MRETAPGRWSPAEQDEIWTRWRRGESFRAIGRHFGTHLQAVRRFLAPSWRARAGAGGRRRVGLKAR